MNAKVNFALTLLLMVAACSGSPEIRYYTLSAESASLDAVAPTRLSGRAYAVDAVVIPDVLDRPQLVLRSGPNAVQVLDYDRWASPLPDQLQRVFTADLSARLGGVTIVDPGLPLPPNSGRIAISILTFDLDRHGESFVDVSWAVSDTEPGTTKSFHVRHGVPNTGSDIAALVASMSRAVAMVAKDITVSLASVASP